MFDYLGGPGVSMTPPQNAVKPIPLPGMLPPSSPGTMASAVPGSNPLPPGLDISGPIQRATPPRPDILAAIQGIQPGGFPPPEAPPLPEYGTRTQEDGTILLHIKNADGSLGPAVKIIPAIKQKEQAQA